MLFSLGFIDLKARKLKFKLTKSVFKIIFMVIENWIHKIHFYNLIFKQK